MLAALLLPAIVAAQTVVDFTTAGTTNWQAPAGVTSVTVELWGAGGSGGGASTNSTSKGGGGAGGTYVKSIVSVTPGNTYAVVVGAVGTTNATGDGGAGNASTFGGTTVVAQGGAGGIYDLNGGAGGQGSCTGSTPSTTSGTDVCNAGGNGSNGGVAQATGGAGGGGAGTTGPGGNASGNTAGTGTSLYGGDGAAGRTTGGAGTAGVQAGGGGSAGYATSNTNRAGGAGGIGRARLTYAAVTTLGDGASLTAAPTLGPGGALTDLDAFTLQTDSGTDSVTSVTVTLGPTEAFNNVGTVTVTSDDGLTTYGTVTNPTSNTVTFTGATLTTNLPVSTTATQFRVKIQPKSHANMPAVPGASYATTGTVTAYTCTNGKAGADTGSDTVTIDNLSPANVGSFAASNGNAQSVLTWTNPGDADFLTGGTVVVVRDTNAITWTPTEGAAYADGATIAGSLVVACVVTGSPPAATCTEAGLTNGQPYNFRAFARDARGNYAATAADTTATPTSDLTIGNGSSADPTGTLNAGDTTALDYFTLATGSGTSDVTQIDVQLTGNAALSSIELRSGTGCAGALVGTPIANPTGAPSFSGFTQTIGTSATSYTICGTGRVVASNTPVNANVSGVTYSGTFNVVDNDTASTFTVNAATLTFGNGADPSLGSYSAGQTFLLDQFTLSTSASSTNTSAVALSVTGGAALSTVTLRSGGTCAGAVLATMSGSSFTVSLPASTSSSSTVYAICGVAASVGSNTTVSVNVSGVTVAESWAFSDQDTSPNHTVLAASVNAITLVSASDPAAARVCPGAPAQYADRFGFTVTGAGDLVSTITFQGLDASVPSPLASIEIRDDFGNALTPARTGTPLGDSYLFGSANLSAPVGTTYYRLFFTPKDHALLANKEYTVVATVQGFTSTNPPGGGTDAASTFTIDDLAPAQAAWGANVPGNSQVQLQWTNPTDAGLSKIVVLRRTTSAAFTETLADGTVAPAETSLTADGSYVVYSRDATSGAPVSFTDTSVSNGNSYVYRVYALDGCGNYNSGVASAAQTPTGGFVAEGSTASGAPMVSIVNPMKGAVVSGTIRVQIRVHDKAGISNITAGSLAYRTTEAGGWNTIDMTARAMPGYDTLTNGVLTGRTYEVHFPTTPGAAYVLRATVANAVATVLSNGVAITAAPSGAAGDGRLVVRDNSSQLCADCHALAGHTSETTASTDGSWATNCRDCHAAHGTKNIMLIAEKITPPSRTQVQTEKTVVFYNKTGQADASYASSAGTGPCQVCHTRTTYYGTPSSGGANGHYTTSCGECHVHTKGLAASCTQCHGTENRGSIGGADARQNAAPPAVATKTGQTVIAVAGGGAHVKHVNATRWRSAPLQCAACHPSPNTHQATTQTDVAWTGLASGGGANPYPPGTSFTLDPPAGAVLQGWVSSPTCTNYCHGGSLGKANGSNRTPSWSGDATQASCGTCHQLLPPLGGATAGIHPQNTSCATCHGPGYSNNATTGVADTAKPRHIDNVLDAPSGCTACHGKLTGFGGPAVANGDPSAAPGYDDLAVDVDGKSNLDAPRTAGVGAHGKHVNALSVSMMSAKACIVCHPAVPAPVPPATTDTTHVGGGATAMAWTSPANAGGYTSPSYATAGNSCLNYCHSTGKPLDIALTTRSATWTSTTAMSCGSCHDGTMTTNAHDVHAPKYTCNTCHVGTTLDGAAIKAGGGKHVDGSNDVEFDASDLAVQGGVYTSPSCSNIYCHSNGTKRSPAYTSPAVAWNAAPGSLGCTGCHGGPAGAGQIATGKHPNHVNVAGTIGGAASTNFECGTCHATTVAPNTNSPVTTATNHVDRNPSVSFDPFYGGTFTGGAEGAGSCASNYCHSSGQDPAAIPAIIQYLSVAWNDAALGCDGCHGRYGGGAGNGTGAPNYPSGGEAAPTANSHAKHVSAATDCATCHAGTAAAAGNAILATSTLHLDKQRQVQIDAAHDSNGAGTSNYDQATKTCSGISCHGAAGTPKWGGPPQKCSDCHAGASDADSFTLLTPGSISTSEWTARGHGQSTFGVNTFPTLAGGTPCLYCHDSGSSHRDGNNPFRLRGSTVAGGGAGAAYSATTASSANQVCLNCHAVSGANGVNPPDGGALGTNPAITSTKKIDAYHAGAKHGAANGGTRCWDCHDAHGDGSNVAMIGVDLVRTATDNHSFAATRVTGVAFTANATGTDYAGAGTKVCNACHAGTLYYLANGTGNQTHQSGARCVACHVHQQTPDLAFKEATACNACHNSPPTVGNHAKHIQAIQASPAYGSTTIGSTGTTYGYQCGICHTTNVANHVKDTGGTVADPYTVDVTFSIGPVTAYTQGASSTTETGAISGLVFKGTNGSCQTVYCHDPLGAAYTSTNVTWTQAPGSIGCTACHPMSGANSTALTNRHDRHVNASTGTPVAGYGYGCERCHSSTTTTGNTITNTAQHAVNSHNVAFNSNPVNQTAGTYTIGSNGACGNTYCHSNGQSTSSFGAPNVALAWNAASGTATCSSCHAGYTGTVMATGKHTQHANNPSLLTTSYYCADCHATTVTGTVTPAVDYAGGKHVNGTREIRIANRGSMVSADTEADALPLTCDNTYCHSNGQRQFATKLTVTWSDAAWTGNVCVKCHGTEGGSIAGEPRYTGANDTATANSHAKHVGAGADCATCHNGIVNADGTAITSTLHTNGAIDVVFNQTLTGATSSHTDGAYTPPGTYVSATCTNISCHGTNPTAVEWGQTLDCSGCHMGATGTADAEVDDYNYNNGTFAKLDPEDWVTSGHGRPSGSNYDSGNAAAAFDTNVAVSPDDGCKYCHSAAVPHGQFGTAANPFRLANIAVGANTAAAKNHVCTVCHGGTGYLDKPAAKPVDATHYGAKHTSAGTLGGQLCWDCHDPHGDSRYTTNNVAPFNETPNVAANEVLGYMIDAKLVRTHPTAEGNTTEWGTNGTTGPTYAPSSPRFNKSLVAPTTSYDWGDYALASPYNGVCQVCHTATSRFKADGSTWAAASNPDSGVSGHNTTKRCTSCHTHDQPPTDAFKASCTGCHGNKGALRTPVAGADTMLEYAPPTARDGTTSATTANGVGAHQSHVNQLTLRSAALSCSQCHGASLPAAGHPSAGQAPISWGALATTGGITTATYTQGTGCSATYCHGNFKNGNDRIGPDAPTGLVISAVTDNTLTVSWGAVAGATAYKIERAPDVGGAPGTFVQVGATTTTSFNDGGLWAATRYWYRVRAWNRRGDGAYSGNVSQQMTGGTPGAPVAKNYAWQWTSSGVYSGLTANMPALPCGDTTYPSQTSERVTTMSSTPNACVMRLYTTAGSAGNTPILTIVLTTPYSAATAITAPSITWNTRTGVGTTTLGTQLGYVTAAGAFTGFGTMASTSVSTTIISASPNMASQVGTVPATASLALRFTRVSADSNILRFYFSNTLGITNVSEPGPLVPPALPAPPTGTPTISGFSGVGETTLTLAWSAVTNATSYKVERALAASGPWTQVGQPTATSFTDNGLTGNTTYFYQVRASNAGGDAPSYSATASRLTAPVTPSGIVTAWTGTFTPGATTLTCTSCHGDPPGGTHPASTDCNLCHPGYSSNAVVNATHIDGTVDKVTDCTICHSVQLGSRRPIVSEFGMTWSHKRSGGGTVTNYDCIVCHMEGDPATGLPTDGGAHMNGVLNLRDPDTGANIKGVTFSVALGGATEGAYSSTASDSAPAEFSRNLSSATIEPDVAAIQVNQCLKCHDSNGATAFLASNPNAGGAQGALYPMRAQGGTRSAEKPFGTTISYASIPAAQGGTATAPSGTQTANGVSGGVIDVATSFLTTNSSYHPVSGRNNNSFVYGARAWTPWDTGITARTQGNGAVNVYGYLISCWDCHAEDGTPTATVLNRTVTAHGGATTVRGTPTTPNPAAQASATNEATLCKVCHKGYFECADSNDSHCAGSAMNTGGQSPMGIYMRWGCNMCHASTYGAVYTGAVPAIRPVRAQDVHGVNDLPTAGVAKTGRWSGASTGNPLVVNARPYAFIRNTWSMQDHQPAKIGTSTYTANCKMSNTGVCSRSSIENYTPGGTY